jgi:hypothetical protein
MNLPPEPDLVDITLLVTHAFDTLSIPYLLGGSLASVLYGPVRTTVDADLVADVHVAHAGPLTALLKDAFYVEPGAIIEAVVNRSSFNVIHLETSYKVDVFVLKQRPFDAGQFQRRSFEIVATEPERKTWVASPEDTVLAKLEWFRMGGEVSERQWRDVLGVIKTQGQRLDLAYMRQWAAALNVADLLELALTASDA